MKKRKKVAGRKKSEKRVRGSDESEGSGGEAPKRKAGGGFQKPFNLSPQLAEVCGETQVCPLVVLCVSMMGVGPAFVRGTLGSVWMSLLTA